MPSDPPHRSSVGSPYESVSTPKSSGAHLSEGSRHFTSYHPPPMIPPPPMSQGPAPPMHPPRTPNTPSILDRLDVENLDTFYDVAARLLSRYADSRYRPHPPPAEEILLGIIRTGDEQRAFAHTLRNRFGELPTFPEVGEPPTSSLIRDIDKIFGRTLKDFSTRLRKNTERVQIGSQMSTMSPNSTQGNAAPQAEYNNSYQQAANEEMGSSSTPVKKKKIDVMNQQVGYPPSQPDNDRDDHRQMDQGDARSKDERIISESRVTSDRYDDVVYDLRPEPNDLQQVSPMSNSISRTLTLDATERNYSKPPGIQTGIIQPVLQLNSPVDETQSKMKQRLLDEMEHASQILQSTENEEVRSQYLRHMKDLRLQWEKLKQQPSSRLSSSYVCEHSGSRTGDTANSAKYTQPVRQYAEPDEISVTNIQAPGRQYVEPDLRSVQSSKSVWSVVPDDNKSIGSMPASKPMGKQLIDVVAPDNLPANFSFEARLGDQVFIATVVSCWEYYLRFLVLPLVLAREGKRPNYYSAGKR